VKIETIVIAACCVFFVIVTPTYWWISDDVTGTAALTMTTLLVALLAFFLGVVSRQIPDRPEDRKDAEVADGAGELGFFPPYSWWPLFCGGALAVCVLGIVFGWWLFIIGIGIGVFTLSGFVFEYYRGYHAH